MSALISGFFYPLSPFLSLVGSAVLVLGVECVSENAFKKTKTAIALLGVLSSIFFTLMLWHAGLGDLSSIVASADVWLQAFLEAYALDNFSLAFFMGIGVFTFISLAFLYLTFGDRVDYGEILILTLFVAAGMVLLVSAYSLLIIFLALELISLPTYVLVGMKRGDRQSAEAALKYFLFGAFASALLVLGIALIYAQFGTLNLLNLSTLSQMQMSQPISDRLITHVGLAILIVAAGFKVGLVPFHMWVPDVYQGAHSSITGFMGSAIKLVGFGLMIRLLWVGFLPLAHQWIPILNALAIFTMFVGNLAALVQDNLKRMFAYSSIAHAGYLLLGITSIPLSGPTPEAVYYYLIVYGLMFLGLFGILALVENQIDDTDISRFSGFGFTHPVLGACLTLFTLSLAGIPPTAGFFAKYFLFIQVVKTGNTPLLVLAMISVLIGAYYYLRLLVYLYMKDSKETLVLRPSKFAFSCIVLCALSMLYFAVDTSLIQAFFTS